MSCSRAPQTAGDAAAEVGAGGRASQEQAPDDSHLAHVCADVKTGEGGYVKLAIIMSMMAQTIQCGGVCAKRLGSDLTTYRLETACTTTRTLPECSCHCFPCLLCVPRLETCTLGCPPRGASSTLRDTDLFIFWGAYCLWFVPLLRMFRGTAGWRRACACAHDKADESTPAHTPTYRRAQAVNGELQPDDVQARDGVHDDGDAAGVQLPLLPLPALRSPVWRHALSTPPTPARRCVMWIFRSLGAYCL